MNIGDDGEALRVAYHEAGHAVLHYRLKLGVRQVQMAREEDPRGIVLGQTWPSVPRRSIQAFVQTRRDRDVFIKNPRTTEAGRRREAERCMWGLLAGYYAEGRYIAQRGWAIPDGEVQAAGSRDMANARQLAATWDLDVDAACYQSYQSFRMVCRYWDDIERLALALLEHRMLTSTQVRALLARRKRRPDPDAPRAPRAG